MSQPEGIIAEFTRIIASHNSYYNGISAMCQDCNPPGAQVVDRIHIKEILQNGFD